MSAEVLMSVQLKKFAMRTAVLSACFDWPKNPVAAPLMAMALRKSPCIGGEMSALLTSAPPADCPNMVTFVGSPAKYAMFSLTQVSAACASHRP